MQWKKRGGGKEVFLDVGVDMRKLPTSVSVRMARPGLGVVGLLDIRSGRVRIDPEDVIQLSLLHRPLLTRHAVRRITTRFVAGNLLRVLVVSVVTVTGVGE